MIVYTTTLSSTIPLTTIRSLHTLCGCSSSYILTRRCRLSTAVVQNNKSDNWEQTLTSITTSESLFEEYGPVKLSLALQACTRSKYFRSKDNWPIVDKAFTKVAVLLIPTNLDKFNTQDLVLTLKAFERYIKERSYRWSNKGRGMSESSIDLLQDNVTKGCINILDNLRENVSFRTPLREMGMTLSSIVAVDALRDSNEANKLIPHILNCITEGHHKGTLTISSAKIGDEAFGQGIANVAMALAKLRYEDSSFMDTLAGIISGSVRSFTLVDIGQIAFAFGKLHLAASSSSEKISTMFGYIADRVADDGVEESLSDNLPAACSLLYGMHRLGLECQEFSDLIAAKLLPHVNLLGPNKLLLILPACRNLSNTVKASSGMSTSSDALYRSAGKAFAEKAASLSMGLLIQGLTCVHPYDLEDISQQLRHRGNATWIYHARYGVSILQALVNNFTALDDKMTLVPGPETCELVREICHHLGNDDRLFGQLDSDQKKVLLALPQLSYFTHLGALQKVLASPIV